MPSPSVVTTNRLCLLLERLLGFTCKVLSLDACWLVDSASMSVQGEHFSFVTGRIDAALMQNPG